MEFTTQLEREFGRLLSFMLTLPSANIIFAAFALYLTVVHPPNGHLTDSLFPTFAAPFTRYEILLFSVLR